MIGIIEYGAGNTASVSYALDRISTQYKITNDVSVLQKCEKIIFPGVGAAKHAMNNLIAAKIDTFLRGTDIPVLGICLGMQLLTNFSEEGEISCVGVLPENCVKFTGSEVKIPHMGWSKTSFRAASILFNGLGESEYFYFAHSYYLPVSEYSSSVANNGVTFSASVQRENFYGVQFHPEKSGSAGLRVLQNFIKLT